MDHQIKIIYNSDPLDFSSYQPRFDDTIEAIKQKIFAGTASDDDEILFYPPFQKLTVLDLNGNTVILDGSKKVGDRYVSTDRAKTVLAEATQTGYIKNNIIVVEDLIDILGEMDDLDSTNEKELLEALHKDFPNLTNVELKLAKEMLDETLSNTKLNSIKKDQQDLADKFEKGAVNFDAIAQIKKDTSENTRKITAFADNRFQYSLLQALLDFPNLAQTRLREGKKLKTRNFLDLKVLFNSLSVNENMPFVSVASEPKQPPFIKVFNGIPKDVAEKWILVERTGKVQSLKQPKGLTVRLHTSGNNYLLLNLFSDAKVSMRCSWPDSDKANQKDLMECIKSANKFIKNVNRLQIAFKETVTIPELKFENAEIRTLDAQLQVNTAVKKQKLKSLVQTNSIIQYFTSMQTEPKLKKQLCKELGIKDCGPSVKITELRNQARIKGISLTSDVAQKDQISLQYKRVSTRASTTTIMGGNLIVSPEKLLKVILTFRANPLYDNSSIISIKNARSFMQLDFLFDFSISLLYLSDPSLKEVAKTVKGVPKAKKGSKLKEIKKAGVGFQARDCQKIRQMTVDNDNQIKPIKDSYKLTIGGNVLVCTSQEYPYPGFTAKGTPCCFKKDQRTTKKFEKFYQPEKYKKRSAEISEIKKENIITTDKVLDPGRIGLLPDAIQKYFLKFDPNFFRVGVFQGGNSFLYAVYEAVKHHRKIKSFADFKVQLLQFANKTSIFTSLQNGAIGHKFKKDEYLEFINSETADHTVLIGLCRKFLKLNLFVFSEQKQNIVCFSDYDSPKDFIKQKEPSVFIIKKKSVYEPIFIIDKKVTRVFDTAVSDVTKNLYLFSCESTPLFKTRFSDALNAKQTIQKLKPIVKENVVLTQMLNPFNKVSYIKVTKGKNDLGFMIPVKPSGSVAGVPVSKLVVRGTEQAKVLIEKYKKIAKKTGIKVNVVEQILENNKIKALVLANGFIVPTLDSDRMTNLPVSKLNFNLSVDEYILSGLSIGDARTRLLSQIKLNKGLLQQVRFEISNKLTDTQRNEIIEIIQNSNTSFSVKMNKVSKIVSKLLDSLTIDSIIEPPAKSTGLCSANKSADPCKRNGYCSWSTAAKKCRIKLPKSKKKGITYQITLELVRDTIQQNIVKKKVILESSLADEFIQRPNETILFDLKTALKWLKK